VARLTQEYVWTRVEAMSLPYRESLLELFERASREPEVGRVELDIQPEFAADRFPVVALEFTKDREDVSGHPQDDFRSLGPLLPGYESLPIGRHELAGFDFTLQADWISAALLAKTRSIWPEIESRVPRRLDVFVGTCILAADDDVDLNVLNLRTGCWESRRNAS
jgi:hypothetical protein